MRWSVVLACILLTVAAASPARADEPIDDASRATVRELGYAGIADYEAGRYADAVDKLERAYQVVKAPALALWSARALAKVGRLVEASERYLDATRIPAVGDADVQERARRDAGAERADLDKRVPRLLLRIKGAGDVSTVTVNVDGKAIPSALLSVARRVDPGTHTVTSRRGDEVIEQKIEVAEREERALEIAFTGSPEAKAAAPPRPEGSVTGKAEVGSEAGGLRRTATIASFVVGGVGLVTALVTGALALNTKSELDDSCPDRRCLPPSHGAVDRYDLLQVLSTAGFVTAGVGAAAGTFLWVTAPSSPQKGAAAPSAAVLGLRGSF